MIIAYLLILPVATAFSAWLSAWLILYMVLYPLQPRRVMGFTFHGLLLRYRPEIAEKVGEGVMRELAAGGNDMQLVNPDTIKELQPVIEQHLDNFLRIKLKEKMPVISAFIGDKTVGKLKDGMMEEIELLLPEIIERYTQSITTNPAIKATIVQKISTYPAEQLEAQIGPPLKHAMARVPLIAALVGMIIGLVVSGVMWLSA